MPALSSLLTLAVATVGACDETVVWPFTIATAGADVQWTSPSPTNPHAPTYDATFEIAQLQVWVSVFGSQFGPFDATDQIPPENRSGSGSADGPAPATLFDADFVAPPPPEPVSFGAHLVVALDGAGVGTLSLTDVVLGTLQVDLGFPFGVQTVQLEQIQLDGTVHVTARFDPADVTHDGTVDFDDVLAVLSTWGSSDACAADADDDGVVAFGDLLLVLSSWS